MAVTSRGRGEILLSRYSVAPQGHNILYPQEIKVYKNILHLLYSLPSADYVRHNLYLKLLHYGCRNGNCARTFGYGNSSERAVGVALILNLVSMRGYIKEWRGKLHKRSYRVVKFADVAPLKWRNQFKRGKWPL